jgi:RNA-directed DNA polymerase
MTNQAFRRAGDSTELPSGPPNALKRASLEEAKDLCSSMPAPPLNINHYMSRMKELASEANLDGWQLLPVASYASALAEKGYPIIFDHHHFALLVGYSDHFIFGCANGTHAFYRSFEIKKRTEGYRRIDEPLPSLKEIQSWMLKNILQHAPIAPAAKAYHSGANVLLNAKFHVGQPVLIRLDIKNFFPSITIGAIFRVFKDFGYTSQLASLFSHLCCLKGSLPQGAPTSPALSNIVLAGLDKTLLEFAIEQGIRYTRYADDLTFSGVIENPVRIIRRVRTELRALSFELNQKKIAVQKTGARQVVTGIIVNDKLNTSRDLRRQFRQEMFFLKKYGLDGHLDRLGEHRQNYLEHMIGIGNFIAWVDKRNVAVRKDVQFLEDLNKVYRLQS